MEKSQIRRQMRSELEKLSDKINASKRITEYAVSETAFKVARNVFIFISTDSEPCTRDIIAKAFGEHKRVFVPFMKDGEMRISEYFCGAPLIKGAYGISEPAEAEESNIEPDVAFVPLVAFDSSKNRLGHGKGCYDRYLTGRSCAKIALAFALQRVPEVPVGPDDVAMDAVITEEGVLR